MNIEPTLADSLRKFEMKWIWIAAFVVVALTLGILNPWETVEFLIQNQGIGEAGKSALAVVAGFTAPLTFGFGLIVLFLSMGLGRRYSTQQIWFGAGVVLYICGFLSQAWGFGLPPSYTGSVPSGPPLIVIPLYVLFGYWNSYGLPLMICALTLGTAGALHVERLIHSDK